MGMFAAGTHTQTEPGLIEHEPDDDHRNQYQSSGDIVGEYILQEHTQSEVAKKLGISQVQVSRLEKKILKKMREDALQG